MKTYCGNIVDVHNSEIYKGTVLVENGIIRQIIRQNVDCEEYIMPGFIDAHVHIESSMLIPSEFARIAVIHGTVATVSDPHEIANVLGVPGVKYMIENGSKVPFHFFFGAPSCVPATAFETSGAVLGLKETEELLRMNGILYLSEMMNFPGVLYDDEEVLGKLRLANKFSKPVDGHAPGLTGNQLKKYTAAGINTDHECFTIEEAIEKIEHGMKILIREGSAARNFDALIPLLARYPEMLMFCSDDKHPDDLIAGHINLLARRAISAGYNLFSVLRACSLNPVQHYGLGVGLLREGDAADFIIVENLGSFNVLKTIIGGELVADDGKSYINSLHEECPNAFNASEIRETDLKIPVKGNNIKVIRAMNGQLITESIEVKHSSVNGFLKSDTKHDILKIMVMNRYTPSAPALAFVNGFGLKRGAIASSVAHDSHNIIAVGANDEDIVNAVNLLISKKGGVVVYDGNICRILPLPVAGIMSADDGFKVATAYHEIDRMAKELGSTLSAPFMTLSFMALLVIPAIKLSDKGLFDGTKFCFTDLNDK